MALLGLPDRDAAAYVATVGPLWRAALGASALVVALLAVPAPGTAAPTYSQFDPPPLCSEAPPDWDKPCVYQPDAFVHISAARSSFFG